MKTRHIARNYRVSPMASSESKYKEMRSEEENSTKRTGEVALIDTHVEQKIQARTHGLLIGSCPAM